MTFTPEADTALKCMVELAEYVRFGLGSVDPYFGKLADATLVWCEAWKQCNPEAV